MTVSAIIVIVAIVSIWLLLMINVVLIIAGYQYYLECEKQKENPPMPKEKLPFVSVMVPAHNEAKVIGQTVEALLSFDYPKDKYEIIVINDNSTDNSAQILASIQKKNPERNLIVINTDAVTGGKGKSNALNIGYGRCKGEVIGIYDADNTPEKKALRLLVEEIISDQTLGAVIGKFRTRNKDASLLTRFINIETLSFQWMAQAGRWKLFRLCTIPGTNFVIRRSVIEAIGGWDEKAIAEDTEISFRIYMMGFRIKFVPQAVTWEQEPQTIPVWFKQRTRWVKGNIYVLVKNFPLLFKKEAKTVRFDICYFLSIYFILLSALVISDSVMIASLLGWINLNLAGFSTLLWGMAIILFMIGTFVTLSTEKGEMSISNFLIIAIMYFTYSKMWMAVAFYGLYKFIEDKIKKRETKWYKTERYIFFLIASASLFCFFKMPVQAEEKPYTQEIKIGQDVSLSGLFDSSNLYFKTGNWEMEDARLQLVYNTSQLLNQEVSYWTISLNGIPFETNYFENSMAEVITEEIIIPKEQILPNEVNTLTVEVYLRGKKMDACVDDSSIATWMNLFSDSQIFLSYKPITECKDIASFYEKFLSIEALERKESALMISEKADDSVLTAMSKITAGIASKAQGDYEKLEGKVIKNQAQMQQSEYAIYVQTYDQLPEYFASQLTDGQKKAAKEDAIVCLLEQEGTTILLVTGNNAKALENAGDFLSNPEEITGEKTTQKIIREEENYKMKAPIIEEYMPLTENGVMVKGLFEQTIAFGMEGATNRRLADSAELSFDFSYSDNLDFTRSLVTVLVDGIPIGSRSLNKEGADFSTELFTIPEYLDIVGDFMIEVNFMLYPKEEWCELTPEKIPWAYVHENSMLKWSFVENTDLFFEYYPFPFIKEGEFSETIIILPKEYTQEDFNAMTGIVLALGKWQKGNGGSLQVKSQAEAQSFPENNLIVIHPKEAVPYSKGRARLETTTTGNKLYGILTVSGDVLDYLGSPQRMWELEGDELLITEEELICKYNKSKNQTIEPPAVTQAEVLKGNIPLVIVVSFGALMLLSFAMIIIKYAGKQKEKED